MIKKLLHPFVVLKFVNYRLLTIGSFISFIGTQMQTVGISWHLYSITHSAYSLGLIGIAGFLPMIFLSPFSGVIVDAFDRKKLMVINQVLFAVVNTAFAILTLAHKDSPGLIYVVVAINAIINIVDLPTRQSVVPSLVPKNYLIQAFNFNTITRQTALIIGPAIAGYLIAFHGVASIYILNAISFIALLGVVLPLTIEKPEQKKEVPISLHSVLEGIRFIVHTPVLYSTMILDFVANFFAASTVIFPIFAAEVLHIPTQQIGLLYAAPSIGAVLVGLLIGFFSHIKSQGKLLLYAVGMYALATIGFGISKNLWLSLFFLGIVGGADMISMVIRRTISQLVTPDHIRGRMNAINMVFFAGGPFLGEAEAGFVAGLLGAPLAVMIGGVGATLSVLGIAYWVPQLTQYKQE